MTKAALALLKYLRRLKSMGVPDIWFGTAGNTTRRMTTAMALGMAFVLAGAFCLAARATKATPRTSPPNQRQHESHIGDVLAFTPPLAKLSPALTTVAIDAAVRKVGNWQLDYSEKYFSRDWTFAALYAGYMAAAKALPDQRFQDAMLRMGNKFNWQLNPVGPTDDAPANDHAVGQTYLDLYQIYHQKKMMLPTQETLDALMKVPDVPGKPVWWWCDALFMGPPTWARIYEATGNRVYLDYMDREFWITSNLLYRPQEKLYSRDATYLKARSKNGQLIFWSRGNGWVMAGIARTLDAMPKDYPSRPKYVEQFKQMASRIATLQGADGLWRTDLLDPVAYPAPEVSGSAFYVYALAWGINRGILDRATYLPIVKKGWQGLLVHVYEDGRLGSIQSVNQEPGVVPPTSSYVYGVGGFLLAGAELHRLAEHQPSRRSAAAF
jgi:rhamnogalacturonyl hydrolase YesR